MTDSILIKRDDLKYNPLEDRVLDDVPPPTWTSEHVGKRITEAFATLRNLPMLSGGSSNLSYWPAYSYEWEDLLAQQEQELEEQKQQQQKQNRVREAPTIEAVTRMEAALYWPARYLSHAPSLMRGVNAVAFTHALERDIGWLARRRGGSSELWRRRHSLGCDIIARGLMRDKVRVF